MVPSSIDRAVKRNGSLVVRVIETRLAVRMKARIRSGQSNAVGAVS